jgi:hypothetical protein
MSIRSQPKLIVLTNDGRCLGTGSQRGSAWHAPRHARLGGCPSAARLGMPLGTLGSAAALSAARLGVPPDTLGSAAAFCAARLGMPPGTLGSAAAFCAAPLGMPPGTLGSGPMRSDRHATQRAPEDLSFARGHGGVLLISASRW